MLVFSPIAADTPLARLFSAYQEGLCDMALTFQPYDALRTCRSAFARDVAGLDEAADTDPSMAWQAQRYYELATVGRALPQLHRAVVDAVAQLDAFFTTHHGDLQAYAVANRLAQLEKYGSEDDSDWERVNPGREPAIWRAVYKDDAASLREYMLHRELSRWFPNDEYRGECIGSSGPEDFASYTHVVATQTDTPLHQLGRELSFTPELSCPTSDVGQPSAHSLADRIEADLNTDLRNARVAEQFTRVLTLGEQAAALYARLAPDQDERPATEQVAAYRTLQGLLLAMLHLTDVPA